MTSALLDVLEKLPTEDRRALLKLHGGAVPDTNGLGAKPAILVVDMMRAFVENRFSSGWAATGEPCVRAISGLLATARPLGVPVIYTRAEATHHASAVGRWRRTTELTERAPLFIQEGEAIVSALAPDENDITLRKSKPSAFFGTQLTSILIDMQVDSLIITGMTTSGCVRASVVDAFELNYKVIVPIQCVADRSQSSHLTSLVDIGVKYDDLAFVDAVTGELRGACRIAQ